MLAIWAADCAEHVLPYFEERYPKDDRPEGPSKYAESGRARACSEWQTCVRPHLRLMRLLALLEMPVMMRRASPHGLLAKR